MSIKEPTVSFNSSDAELDRILTDLSIISSKSFLEYLVISLSNCENNISANSLAARLACIIYLLLSFFINNIIKHVIIKLGGKL